jgi:hypothetical protein
MFDRAELKIRLREFAYDVRFENFEIRNYWLDRALLDAAEAIDRCEASLATCETRREALEAENTFLREEISAAAQRLKALAPRGNESGEGI